MERKSSWLKHLLGGGLPDLCHVRDVVPCLHHCFDVCGQCGGPYDRDDYLACAPNASASSSDASTGAASCSPHASPASGSCSLSPSTCSLVNSLEKVTMNENTSLPAMMSHILLQSCIQKDESNSRNFDGTLPKLNQ